MPEKQNTPLVDKAAAFRRHAARPLPVPPDLEGGGAGSSIRAVERAIDLLQALNRRPISTLHELHQDTGLPKPSIIRLLRTFEAKGLVTQSPSYGTYQLLGHVRSLSSGFHHEPLIVELADPMLVEMTQEEGWPLALALFDIDAMVVRASTIPYTSLSLFHSSLNMRLSMVSTALGRAYLGHCQTSERRIILQILKGNDDPQDEMVHQPRMLNPMLARVREQGYALRDPLVERRSATMAVPVFENGRVVAAVGLTWIRAALSEKQAVDAYFPKMRDLADRISRALSQTPSDVSRLDRAPLV